MLPGQRQLPSHITNQAQDVGDGQKMVRSKIHSYNTETIRANL
jgi:hypothetical protein